MTVIYLYKSTELNKSFFFTFSIVRLCFNIVAQPIHLSFKANSTAMLLKARSSIELCTQTDT